MDRKTVAIVVAFLTVLAVGSSILAITQYPRLVSSLTPETVVAEPPTVEKILELENIERAKVGVAPLVLHQDLQTVAQAKADDMYERGYFDHYLPGTENTDSYENWLILDALCEYSSENIYWGRFANTSEGAMSGWMNSPPHKKAILDPRYTYTGIGIREGKISQAFCIAR